ncbi:MAG: hypothetical protein RIT14_600 [Pseudomonadota bacterium]|jgi:prepilin peptidase CpaA
MAAPSLELIASILAVALFSAAMIYAALRDVLTLSIPDGLILMLVAGWLLLAPAAGLTAQAMALSLGAAAMVFFATVAVHALGWTGGSSMRLATAATLWLGGEQAGPFLATTLLIGGLAGLVLYTLRSVSLPGRLAGQAWLVRLQSGPAGVPHALAIGLAALLTLPATDWAGAL